MPDIEHLVFNFLSDTVFGSYIFREFTVAQSFVRLIYQLLYGVVSETSDISFS